MSALIYNKMKVAAVCGLLLVALTLTSGQTRSSFLVINNGSTYNPQIFVNYKPNNESLHSEEESPVIFPGDNKTVAVQDAWEINYAVFLRNKESPFDRRYIFTSFTDFVPLKMCVKTWGTEADPQVRQVDCANTTRVIASRDDGGAISVRNNATFTSEVVLTYEYKNDQSRKKHFGDLEVRPGETKTILIPMETDRISVDIHKQWPYYLTFRFNQPVNLCFKISNSSSTSSVITQIDC